MIGIKRNVGSTDRIFRAVVGGFLVWFGMIGLKGLDANVPGLYMALPALYLVATAYTGKCYVLRIFKIHSLSQSEIGMYGKPQYKKRHQHHRSAVQVN